MLQRVGSQHGKKEGEPYWYDGGQSELRVINLRAKIGALQSENEMLRQDLKRYDRGILWTPK